MRIAAAAVLPLILSCSEPPRPMPVVGAHGNTTASRPTPPASITKLDQVLNDWQKRFPCLRLRPPNRVEHSFERKGAAESLESLIIQIPEHDATKRQRFSEQFSRCVVQAGGKRAVGKDTEEADYLAEMAKLGRSWFTTPKGAEVILGTESSPMKISIMPAHASGTPKMDRCFERYTFFRYWRDRLGDSFRVKDCVVRFFAEGPESAIGLLGVAPTSGRRKTSERFLLELKRSGWAQHKVNYGWGRVHAGNKHGVGLLPEHQDEDGYLSINVTVPRER